MRRGDVKLSGDVDADAELDRRAVSLCSYLPEATAE